MTHLSKRLLLCLILAIPLGAQGTRGGFFPWWDGPIVNGLDLTDAQRTEIRSVIREYRGRMLEVRGAVQKAEAALDAVFNEDAVDQRKGSDAIDQLTKARADLTKSVSEMSLRMRAVLTTQQWQELRRRQTEQRSRLENAGRGSGVQRGAGSGRRSAKHGSKDVPPPASESPVQTPAPALTQ